MNLSFDEQLDHFIRDQYLGKERQIDQATDLPSQPYRQFSELRLTNWWLPQEMGAHGISLHKSVDIVTKLAYGDCGVTMSLYIPILSNRLVELFGSDEQKQRFLIPLIKSGGYSTLCASEREAGSELLGMNTVCVRKGSKYTLNGVKYFGTNAAFADFIIVICAAQDDDVTYRALIVPKGTPGVRIIQRWPTIGLKGSGAYEVAFENCELDESNVLEGNGLRILEVGLNASRLLIAASGIGIGKRVLDIAMDYARKKPLKGGLLVDNHVFAAKMAQMEIDIETMVAVCNTAAVEYDEIYNSPQAKAKFTRLGIMKSVIVAKMVCAQLGWNIVSVGSQLFGGLGYTDHILMGRLMNDMRYIAIVEGGEDVNRDLMYGRYVKERAALY